MKRVWRFSDAAKAELLMQKKSSKSKPQTLNPLFSNLPKTSQSYTFTNHLSSQSHTPNPPSNVYKTLISLFEDKSAVHFARMKDVYFLSRVEEVFNDLTNNESDSEKISQILELKASALIQKYHDGSAIVELLQKLKPWPQLALEVFNWRRKEANAGFYMASEEYAKGIMIAGRVRNVDFADKLFQEAKMKGIKTASTYNALMGVYMYNSLADECQLLFREFKKERMCAPTIVTYNILLTIFGRLMLVDHMEATYREINSLRLKPNLNTYNHLISGYVTAWMWEDMERVFKSMETGGVAPNHDTHSLMLRGYAYSGDLGKMEKIYELIKDYVNESETSLIRAMICAYCKKSVEGRVKKVEALLKLIPEEEYRPWLNVILIRLYAQEDLMDGMESFISQAFAHNTSVTTVGIMRAIIAAYFRCNALEPFTNFLKQAESSGWRICLSLYHCKMVMYSSANRLEEMERVLDEMDKFNLDPTKKTFMIMYKGYLKWGQKYRGEKLLGAMCKHGYGIPLDAYPS